MNTGNNSLRLRILVAEDDPSLGSILEEYLKLKNYVVVLKENGEDAFLAFQSATFDLCILDVMMPKKDGFTLAAQIRHLNESVPIIFLTARSMTEDVIKGLKLGGDDYITKPFSMEELLLRIEAILKRTLPRRSDAQKLQVGCYEFDNSTQMLRSKKQEHKLTGREADLLNLFLKHKNEVVSREAALLQVWGEDDYFKGRSMDVYIAKLRKILKDIEGVELQNVHGTGFKLVDFS